MVVHVLDASAILRYLDNEAGAERVKEILSDCFAERSQVVVSAVQWGEVAYLVYRRQGLQFMESTLADLLSTGMEIAPVTPERAIRSGMIKAKRKIPYADCFGVELAGDSSQHVPLTADFDVKAAENDIHIEFLPVNAPRTSM